MKYRSTTYFPVVFQRFVAQWEVGVFRAPTARKVAGLVGVLFALCFLGGMLGWIFCWQEPSLPTYVPPQVPHATLPISTVVSRVLQRNIFQGEGLLPESATTASKCPAQAPPSLLPYKIQGILYAGTSATSVVLMSSQNGNTKTYRQGDFVEGDFAISDIQKEKILVAQGNQCPSFLALPTPAPREMRKSRGGNGGDYQEAGFERTGNNVLVGRSWIRNVLSENFTATLEAAKATPRLQEGRIEGFTLTQISPNSVYEKLGFKNGDSVLAINGIELNDAAKAIQTLNAMRSTNDIELKVLRNGETETFQIHVQ